MVDNSIIIDGFIIVPRISPFDRHKQDIIYKEYATRTFAETPERAWKKAFVKPKTGSEFEDMIKRWENMGYYLAPAQISFDIGG